MLLGNSSRAAIPATIDVGWDVVGQTPLGPTLAESSSTSEYVSSATNNFTVSMTFDNQLANSSIWFAYVRLRFGSLMRDVLLTMHANRFSGLVTEGISITRRISASASLSYDNALVTSVLFFVGRLKHCSSPFAGARFDPLTSSTLDRSQRHNGQLLDRSTLPASRWPYRSRRHERSTWYLGLDA